MSSDQPRDRALRALALFTADRPSWTVDALAGALGTSASSTYRAVQELCAAELLSPLPGAGYGLGPAVLLYDRLLRLTDPLLAAAPPVLRGLLDATTQSAVAVLCRRFRGQVLCIHQEPGDGPHPAAAYDRGVVMPLFRGATSRAVLAWLDPRALRRLHAAEKDAAGLPPWPEFAGVLRGIRQAGTCVTHGELTQGSVGVAAPILAGRHVAGSVALVASEAEWGRLDGAHVRAAVKQAADAVAAVVAGQVPGGAGRGSPTPASRP